MDPEEALTLEESLGGPMDQSGSEASASLGFKRVGGGSGTVRVGCKVRAEVGIFERIQCCMVLGFGSVWVMGFLITGRRSLICWGGGWEGTHEGVLNVA